MWPTLFWPAAAMQQGMDLMNRQLLASQCRLLRETLSELSTSARLPHDVERSCFQIGDCDAELISPKGSSTQRYLLYVHGGGFALGSLDTHRELVTTLARFADARVLAIDYRLAPDYPYPAGLDDVDLAYQWLLDQKVPAARIALAGDSAGGGLVVALMQRLLQQKRPVPAAGVLFSPWLDLTCSSASLDLNVATDLLLNPIQMKAFAALYAGREALESPEISPLFGNMRGLPPLLVQVSQQELLLDDARRLAHRITEQAGEVELQEVAWMPHVWQLLYRYLPQAVASLRQASRFIRQQVPAE